MTMTPKVYIFSGNDILGKETAWNAAIRAIEAAAPSIVKQSFDPSSESFGDFLSKVLTPSLFGDMKAVSVRHAEELAEEELDELDRLADRPPEDVYLLIEIGESKRRKGTKADPLKKLHVAERAKSRSGIYLCRDFTKPPEYKAAQWLAERVRDLCGRSIDRDAAEFLVDLVGSDPATLFSEIEKINVNLDAGRRIDAGAVERIVGRTRSVTAFELAKALYNRDAVKVVQVIDSLFTANCSIPMVVGALYRSYGALLRILHYVRKEPGDASLVLKERDRDKQNRAAFRIGRAAGLLYEGEEKRAYPAVIVSGIVGQAQNYSENELESIISMLAEFDFEVKTGRRSGSRHDLELLCYRLLRISTLCRDGEAA